MMQTGRREAAWQHVHVRVRVHLGHGVCPQVVGSHHDEVVRLLPCCYRASPCTQPHSLHQLTSSLLAHEDPSCYWFPAAGCLCCATTRSGTDWCGAGSQICCTRHAARQVDRAGKHAAKPCTASTALLCATHRAACAPWRHGPGSSGLSQRACDARGRQCWQARSRADIPLAQKHERSDCLPVCARAACALDARSWEFRSVAKGVRCERQAAMVSAGERQPRQAASSSSLPALASIGSCARWWPASTHCLIQMAGQTVFAD